MDREFFLTLQAMRRQLVAMPCDYYQIRLIHGSTHKPFPGDRVWSAVRLARGAMVAFLRLRNREGYDIFFHPFAGPRMPAIFSSIWTVPLTQSSKPCGQRA